MNIVNLYLPMLSLYYYEVKNGLIRLFGGEIIQIKQIGCKLWLMPSQKAMWRMCDLSVRKIHKADIYMLLKDMCTRCYLNAEGQGRGGKSGMCLSLNNS